jgi:protein-tyrosine phosphatase
MKVINLESTFNTRDLSALKIDNKRIKENRLIRSGHLHNLTENDVNTLKNLNLKVVIDFRSEHEFIHRSDKRIEGVTYLNFPSLPKKELASKGSNSDSNLLDLVDKEKGGFNMLKETYKNLFLTKEGIESYKNFFKVVTNNNEGAVLWHCSQGKDRAGMAAFLLEYAFRCIQVKLIILYKLYSYTIYF